MCVFWRKLVFYCRYPTVRCRVLTFGARRSQFRRRLLLAILGIDARVCAKAHRTDHPLSRLHLQFKSSTRDFEFVKCRTATQQNRQPHQTWRRKSYIIRGWHSELSHMRVYDRANDEYLFRRAVHEYGIATTCCNIHRRKFYEREISSNSLTDAVTPRPTRSLVVLSSRLVCQYTPLATERELAPPKSNGSNNPPVMPN
jgi:hypothetical protein